MDAKGIPKQFQRRIAALDAQYTEAQPKRPGRHALALIILAIIVVAAFATHRSTSDFTRLTLKQATDAEAQVKRNAILGAASTGFKGGE